MWRGNGPDCRKPMLWPDISYSDDVFLFLPNGKKRTADKVDINQELFAHYQKLVDIRKQLLPLQVGTFKTVLADDVKEIYAFKGEYDGARTKCAIIWLYIWESEPVEVGLLPPPYPFPSI